MVYNLFDPTMCHLVDNHLVVFMLGHADAGWHVDKIFLGFAADPLSLGRHPLTFLTATEIGAHLGIYKNWENM